MEYRVVSVTYTWQCDDCDYKGDGDEITDAQNHANNEQHVVTAANTSRYKVIP